MKLHICAFVMLLGGLLIAIDGSDAGSTKKKTTMPGKIDIKPAPKIVTKPVDKKTTIPNNDAKSKAKVEMRTLVGKSSENWKMDAGQKSAVDKLVKQQPLTDQDRQQVSNLLFNGPQAGLTKEDERMLGELMLDETGRQTVSATSPGNEPSGERTGPWYLRIYNNTGEKLKVFVQVLPNPEEKATAKEISTWSYDLDTGKAYDLQRSGQRIKASAIHIWAISPTRNWVEHREQELRLTTPPNQSKTYMLTFSK